ncbi:ribonuclease E activity regulator RraA [Alicyclobacillus cycloheptanicus]|uniref:4-hydroxy-4-methyl-2-oxoglutarate aldolase n=1 Tax=Alicyclobacillus cycloheptanicus TaxID=1457 RepID=A0ABT9XM81_9BACL|nr:ribonuclease E activity regulator RraA [Alicyclobacillus cycloheptanicus]MDQ0191412.1 regulator of ribonuclease activity A [Alicyclobacillus cycloheptanicus]WDM00324.1 ribonuclease E activity regulator RraA [Alicyclobacillus cycloheptanicus]
MDFEAIRTADISDDHPAETQVCELQFRSFGAVPRFGGPIVTVRVYEDNVLVKQALEEAPAGSVLVVDGGGSLRCALVGGNLGNIAAERGVAGIIVNGAVRDVLELRSQQVGIFALGSNPLKSRKLGEGAMGETVRFGGVDFVPGHYVYADEDGVVVSARAVLA